MCGKRWVKDICMWAPGDKREREGEKLKKSVQVWRRRNRQWGPRIQHRQYANMRQNLYNIDTHDPLVDSYISSTNLISISGKTFAHFVNPQIVARKKNKEIFKKPKKDLEIQPKRFHLFNIIFLKILGFVYNKHSVIMEVWRSYYHALNCLK